MGFFDFFKKPKEKEADPEVTSLTLSEVEPFLEKKILEANGRLASQIKEIRLEINNEIALLKNNLSVLETAEVKNKNLPERALQMMEGNRQIYLSKTRALIEKIVLPQPSDISDFIESFDKDLDNFDKSIAKSHTILEEFFMEKASVIAASIKKIDKYLRDLRKLIEDSDLQKLQDLTKTINSAKNRIHILKENKSRIKELECQLENLDKEIRQKEFQLKKIRDSNAYKDTLSSLNSKEGFEKELNNLTYVMKSSFSEIEPALKKYENLSQNKLAKKYLQDPISALSEDSELEITKILDAIQKAIVKHEIMLKDTKKDRIMNELFKLNSEFLKSFLAQEVRLRNEIAEIDSQLASSQILKDLATLENSLVQDKASLQEKTSSLEKMKKSLDEYEIQELKTKIETDFKNMLNVNISIVYL